MASTALQTAEHEWRANISENGPTSYFSTHGVLFMKRSENPTDKTIVKTKWQMGLEVAATGVTWRGPGGGLWAEMDATRGQFGWALVQGPGFGINGPLLVDHDNKSDLLSIRLHYLGQTKDESKIVYEGMASIESTVGAFCKRVATQCNLNHKQMMLTKGLPGKQPNGTGMPLPADYIQSKDLLNPDSTFAEYEFAGDVLLYLVYTGYWEDFKPQK